MRDRSPMIDRASAPVSNPSAAIALGDGAVAGRSVLLAAGLMALVVGYLLAATATYHGPGLTNDSTMYLGGARELAAGNGYSFPRLDVEGKLFHQPIGLWPPMLSMILGAVAWLGRDPLVAARHFNALLLGVNAVLVGLIVHQATRRSVWPAVFAMALAAVAGDLVTLSIFAWSEPLFIALMLACLWALSADLARPRVRTLVIAAIAAGAAYLTRYAGYALIGTGAAALTFLSTGPSLRRFARAAVFTAIAALAPVAWGLRNALVGLPPATGREARFDPQWHLKLQELWNSAVSWMLPPSIANGRAGEHLIGWLLVCAAAAGALIWQSHRRRHPEWIAPAADDAPENPGGPRVVPVFFIYALAHLLLVGITVALIDPGVVFEARICAPAILALVICAIVATSRVLRALDVRRPAARPARMAGAALSWLILTFGLAVLAMNAYEGLDRVSRARQRGSGMSGPPWRESEGLAYVRRLHDPDAVIFTNGERVLAAYQGRPAGPMPRMKDLRGDRFNLRAMRKTLESTGGAVIYFDSLALRPDVIPPERLAAELELVISRPGLAPDATILRPATRPAEGR